MTRQDTGRPPAAARNEELERFARGESRSLPDFLGAHRAVENGVEGVRFAVWAPSAERVAVVGDFNDWQGGRHPLRPREGPGIWEGFVPGVFPGAVYKYEISTRHGEHRTLKADPCAFAAELRPSTGSIVWDLDGFPWTDRDWMTVRPRGQRFDRPLSIYEVHLGSWRRPPEQTAGGPTADRPFLTYRELAEELVPYAKGMGYTHLELLPVTEHPLDGSWGYQACGYFAPTARFGSPDDFRYLVDTAHRAGLGVILDWVPAHFPRDAHGLVLFDGTPLYEHPDPRRGFHPDWGTYIFDYGKPEVVSFLVSSALFWLGRYHVDGLRVDAVASMLYLDYSRKPGEWVPNEKGGRENLEAMAFLRSLNEAVHECFPGVLTFAEESTAWPGVTAPVEEGGLGFDLKWNMGWMNDTLAYFRQDPLLRGRHQGKLTFSLTYAFDEKFLLPLSHDEVVHEKASLISKMPGPREHGFANVRALLGYMTAHPGKKLLFMGGEIGQWSEWNSDASVEWELLEHEPHRQLHDWVRELNAFYVSRPALWEIDGDWDGFEWIDFSDESRSVLSFVRRARAKECFLIFVANFTPVTWRRYRLGVPGAEAYRPVLDSDEARFGGTGTGMPDRFPVESCTAHGRGQSIVLTLPPLSALFLEPSGKGFWSPG